MRIEMIDIYTPMNLIEDENDNIDVFVKTDEGYIYNVLCINPKNIYWYMDKEELNYMPSGIPGIFVRSLTEDNIRKAIEHYSKSQGYWLKFYGLIGIRESLFSIDSIKTIFYEMNSHINYEFKENIEANEIEYSTPIELIQDIENDSIDIFVKTNEGLKYNITVTTPKNLYYCMDKRQINYLLPDYPKLIVRSLTRTNIEKAIESYLDDYGYWMKVFHLAKNSENVFSLKLLNKMLQEINGENQ
ncbi:hypothetical protein [Chengkuizengella sediminis]|uniref:hypothetical protein n=1 Tax=Chengkuizengella sediminis TaxID=1885917 RepID=UPI001389DFAE|nr:hypothetical protein [Chengkuizengella sediminis]NDI35476.1 hypothetical protein [Chengkuizengella sediminis]